MPVALSRPTSKTRPHRRLGLRAALAVALVVPLGATVVAPASAAPPVPDGAWTDTFDSATLDPRWTAVNDEPTRAVADREPRRADADRAARRHLAGQQLGPQRDDARHPGRRLLDLRERAGARHHDVPGRRPHRLAGHGQLRALRPDLRRRALAVGRSRSRPTSRPRRDLRRRPLRGPPRLDRRDACACTRTGDTITTALLGRPTRVGRPLSTVDVTFDDRPRSGLYALAAQDGTDLPGGLRLLHPRGRARRGRGARPAPFTLQAAGDAPYLTTVADDAIAGADAARPASLRADGDRPRSTAPSTLAHRRPAPSPCSPTARCASGADDARPRCGSPTPAAARSSCATADRRRGVRRAAIVDGALVAGRATTPTRSVLDARPRSPSGTHPRDRRRRHRRVEISDRPVRDLLRGHQLRGRRRPLRRAGAQPVVRVQRPPTTRSFTGLTAWEVLDRSGAGTTGTVGRRRRPAQRHATATYLRLDRGRGRATACATSATTRASPSKAGETYDVYASGRRTTDRAAR